MPLYTYACGDHGQFSAWGRMSESDAPQPCPSCREPAERALARPAIGGRSGDGDGMAASYGGCGEGACAGGAAPMMGGGCCGGGACVH
jgi:putative FmdB family regulatory protein